MRYKLQGLNRPNSLDHSEGNGDVNMHHREKSKEVHCIP
jgi:hypothetical protein